MNVFNINFYLVTYDWKALLTRQIMTLRKGTYIPGQNSGLSKLTRCLTLKECHLDRADVNCTIVFSQTFPNNITITQKGLTTNLKTPVRGQPSTFIVNTFRAAPCFKQLSKRKELTGVYVIPVENGTL